MPEPAKRKLSPPLRVKIATISLLTTFVTIACAILRPRPTPEITCYTVVPTITDTPEPIIMCYEAVAPTEASTSTPTPLNSPLDTPTPTTEARRLLREQLLAEGRFPGRVVREMKS